MELPELAKGGEHGEGHRGWKRTRNDQGLGP